MAGLSKEQLKMLEGMDGIDQDLLSSYRRNNSVAFEMPKGIATSQEAVTGSKKTTTDASSNSVVEEVGSLEAALNVAIDEGRKQRKDKTLDFMNGVVPPGALPATSFASVLAAFDSDSAPLESSLIKSATDFQRDKIVMAEQKKSDVRDLAIATMQAGASQDVVNSIIALAESGDYDAALKIATPAMINNAKAGTTRSVSGNKVVEEDKDGNQRVLYTYTNPTGQEYDLVNQGPDGQQLSGPKGEVHGLFVGREESFKQIPYRDYVKGTKNEALAAAAKYVSPAFAEKLEGFSADHAKKFMQSWIELTTISGAYEDPEAFLKEYADTNMQTIGDVEEAPKKDGDKKSESTDVFDDVFGADDEEF